MYSRNFVYIEATLNQDVKFNNLYHHFNNIPIDILSNKFCCDFFFNLNILY